MSDDQEISIKPYIYVQDRNSKQITYTAYIPYKVPIGKVEPPHGHICLMSEALQVPMSEDFYDGWITYTYGYDERTFEVGIAAKDINLILSRINMLKEKLKNKGYEVYEGEDVEHVKI